MIIGFDVGCRSNFRLNPCFSFVIILLLAHLVLRSLFTCRQVCLTKENTATQNISTYIYDIITKGNFLFVLLMLILILLIYF